MRRTKPNRNATGFRHGFPVLLPVLFLSACAITDMNVDLPNRYEGMQFYGGEGREVVIVVPFSDQRQIKERCGMKKNGYNMDTADVFCSAPPATRLADLLAQALQEAGFRVKTHGEPDNPSGVMVEGTLLKFFVEPVIGFAMGSLETDIQVRLTATSKNGLRAERSFFVKGTKSAMAGTASNYQRSVDQAVKRIVQQMAAAIISLFNQYPQLGHVAPATLELRLS